MTTIMKCVNCGKVRHLDQKNVKQIEKKYETLEKANATYLCRVCKKANKEVSEETK